MTARRGRIFPGGSIKTPRTDEPPRFDAGYVQPRCKGELPQVREGWYLTYFRGDPSRHRT